MIGWLMVFIRYGAKEKFLNLIGLKKSYEINENLQLKVSLPDEG